MLYERPESEGSQRFFGTFRGNRGRGRGRGGRPRGKNFPPPKTY